jgi:hypothetical protein
LNGIFALLNYGQRYGVTGDRERRSSEAVNTIATFEGSGNLEGLNGEKIFSFQRHQDTISRKDAVIPGHLTKYRMPDLGKSDSLAPGAHLIRVI